MSKQQQRSSRFEIPTEEIADLQKSYERVNIKVSRRNHKGHLAHVWSGEKATDEVLTIDQWLRILAGGGDYTIEVRNPSTMQKLLEPFVAVVEGQPRPPAFAGSLPEQQMPAGAPPHLTVGPPPAFLGGPPSSPFAPPPAEGGSPMSAPPYQPPLPPWAAGLAPWDQGGYAGYREMRYPPRFAGANGGTVPSDQLALKQVADLKAENAKLAEKLEGFMSRYESDTGRLRDENATLRAELLAKQSNAELAALKAELQAMREKPAAKPVDWAGVAGIAAALAPVAAAFIQSNAERSSLALRAQQEGTQQLIQATLGQANKDSGVKELLTTLLPLAIPLLTNMMEQKSPEKQAALYEALANSQLNTVSMMAQLVEATAASQGPEPPWWLPAVQGVLQDGLKIFNQYVQTPGGLPGQKPAPAPVQQLPAPQQAKSAANVVTAQPKPTDDDSVPRVVAPELEAMIPHLPADFQNEQWVGFLRALHASPSYTPKYLGEGLAEVLLLYVDQGVEFPGQLQGVLDAPQEKLSELVRYLPITQARPEFVQHVVTYAVEALTEALAEEGGEVTPPVSAQEEIQAATPLRQAVS